MSIITTDLGAAVLVSLDVGEATTLCNNVSLQILEETGAVLGNVRKDCFAKHLLEDLSNVVLLVKANITFNDQGQVKIRDHF